jgi:hypothetical protein
VRPLREQVDKSFTGLRLGRSPTRDRSTDAIEITEPGAGADLARGRAVKVDAAVRPDR